MNSLADFIIRPKRAEYNPDKDLGPKQFFLNSKPKQRIDFEVVNDFSLKLKCSIFAPATIKGQYPCVVYCHGNSACRTEALEAVDLLVPHDIIVVAFDFSGSGVSEGKYVTLGFNEQDDLKCVVNHLRTLKYISEIGLWGRSMGAATCIMYAAKDPNIAAMCLDSGFTNLVQLCTDTLKNRTLGTFLGGMLLGSVRKAIKKKANFELEDVSPINCLSQCKMPAVFLHGTKDDIVPISHSRKLFSEYPGNSKIHELNLSHNDPRPKWIRHEVRSFFVHKFTEAKKKKEFNEHLTSILNIKLNDPNTDHHKLEEFMHRMTYHESENSARSSQKDTQNEPHTQRDYGGFEETNRPAPEPINARNLTHKFSVGNLHPDPQLMKMLRQAAPKISTADSDESGDDEPAMMIKKISATPKWNAFGKIPPLINMPKKVYLSKARHLEENYTQMPRGYHSKMASHEYSSDGEM